MLKNKSVVRLVSIVLAVCIWAYVIGEVNPTVKKTIGEIPVELTNVETLAERGLALQSNADQYAVVVVKGSRSELNQLSQKDIHVTADLYGYEEGENHVAVEVSLPDGISMEELRTPEITVVLEELVTEHIPVTVEFTGESGENMEPTWGSTVPAQIEIKGAASVVAKVTGVKVQLDTEELSEVWKVYSAEPYAIDKKGKRVTNVTLSARSVEIEAVMHHTKSVPLDIKVTGTPDAEYGKADVTVPQKIKIKGNSFALKNIEKIAADDIDISDVSENTTIGITAELPSGIELADSSKDIGVKVEFK